MWVVALGVACLALGLAGVAFAPAMIEAQRERGVEPIASDAVSDADRIAVTRGMGAVFAVAGVLLLGYGLSG